MTPKPKMYAEKLTALFGNHAAVKSVSLPIYERHATAIIGPSGCGKSTFLRCLNRMHELTPGASTQGNVFLDNENINDPNINPVILRQHVGMVFQKPNPFPTMSIRENTLAGLTLQGIKADKPHEVVEKSLRQAALWDEVKDRLEKPGTSLSGGQQQRLCIARALALEPSVLLMDEPCSALDPIATAKIEELLQDLKLRYTIAIVTHSMQQAQRVSDYTAFLYMGELIEFEDTKQLFSSPIEKRTSDYINGRFG
jgi:phosphate transport system ATP-binding protein